MRQNESDNKKTTYHYLVMQSFFYSTVQSTELSESLIIKSLFSGRTSFTVDVNKAGVFKTRNNCLVGLNLIVMSFNT